MNHLPNASLLESRSARIQWARQRFFEEGSAPTHAVGQVVFESWSRCLRRLGSPSKRACFQPVTASRTQLAMLKNRELRQAWTDELPRLESILSSTSCAAMLTDASGVLIGASCVGRSHERLMPVATRLGVDLSEDAVGTTAPGLAVRTGKAVCVTGGEHFFDSVKDMHCAAVPIKDIHGQLAGVFDLSSEGIPFGFDAAAVVGLYAGAIENRLLVAQSVDHLVIRFQVVPELLDSAMVGLLGVQADGRHAWANGVAQRLLGEARAQAPMEAPSDAHGDGLDWARLAALPARGAAPLTLPNGLRVWARAEMRAPDGRRGLFAGSPLTGVPAQQGPTTEAAPLLEPGPEPAPPPAGSGQDGGNAPATTGRSTTLRLRESDLDLIRKTLHACGGNVSDAAARLGVSRGLIYRRLRAAGPTSVSGPH